MLYSVDWTRLHPERKVIVSFYSGADSGDISLQRLDESQFKDDLFDHMSAPLDLESNTRKALSEHRQQSDDQYAF